MTDSVAGRSGVVQLLQTILEQANPPRLGVQYAAHRAVLDGRILADRLAGDGDVAVQTLAQDLVAAIDNHVCEACRPA
ncbi:hypothetical protein [Streptomyces sp. NPDC059802]|uniref:hypothetical protein n=1 Tax=Streptomyces sp. NPDC059802 TaxID=3346952 RepID=UPI003669A473